MTLPFQLPSLGFGAFKIGRNRNVHYACNFDLPSLAETDRLLNGLLDMGLRYIDTAPAYGSSEERIGTILNHRRDEFLISTKVGEVMVNGISSYDFSAAAVRASIEHSLVRLRREALDLVFVHARRDDLHVITQTDVVPTLMTLRDRGDVRAVGLSGYTAEAFQSALLWADAMMVVYHIDDRSLEPAMAQAADRGIAVIVKKGLASGNLAPEQAVRFVLGNPFVTSLLVGSLSLDHMASNLRVAHQVRPTTGAPPRNPVIPGANPL